VLTPLLKGLAIETRTTSQLEMMQHTLLRRPNLDKLINETNLNLYANSPAERQALIEALSKTITITSDGPNLFTIHYLNENPQLAFQVVSGLVNIFMEEATGSSMSDMQNAQRFLNEQIASFEKQLRAAEQRRAAFISKYFEILPLGSNGGAPLQAARGEVERLEGELKKAQTNEAMLQEVMRATPATIKGNLPAGLENLALNAPGTRESLSAQLLAAEERLAELQAVDTDQNPDVITQQQVVSTLKARMQTSSAGKSATTKSENPGVSLPNPSYEQNKMQQLVDGVVISSLQQQLDRARERLAHLEQLARSAPEVQAKFESVDRGYNVLRKQYEELLSRRESSLITAAADTGADRVRLRVIDPPQLPLEPATPNRLLLYSGVLLAGIAGAIGLAFLLSQMDQSVNDLGQLRDIGIPVLGGISAFQPFRRRRMYFQGLTVVTAVIILIALYGGLAIRALPHTKGFL
jgi:polysaccharide chain length determinant protein (PEP-CTERM system associated)